MDLVRQRLVEKIDAILSQMVASDGVPPNSYLQIDATLVLPQVSLTDDKRVLVDSIDIDHLRRLCIGHGEFIPHESAQHQVSNGFAFPAIRPASVSAPNEISHDSSLRDVPMLLTSSSNASGTQTPAYNHRRFDEMAEGENGENENTSSGAFPSPAGGDGEIRMRTGDGEQNLSKRRKIDKPDSSNGQNAVDRLIEGVWEQIHNPKTLAWDDELMENIRTLTDRISRSATPSVNTCSDFDNITKCCRQVTTANRTDRALEVMIQAYWVDCYDSRLAALKVEQPELRAHQHKRTVLTEACVSFEWSEKELRNRMAIWKGYREIKDATGWSALIFAGPGIYRFCKYRLGFDHESITKLQNLKFRAEVAADTLQPQWRQFLALVGSDTKVRWPGHPHDWTVSLKADEEPLPLAVTYRQWDTNFSYANISESVVDAEQWHGVDPRYSEEGPEYYCKSCSLRQSNVKEENECECFPDLYSPNPSMPCPVQVFRTANGKNNGLISCCSFRQGQAVGEFVGLITKGLADVDVMQSQAGDHEPYQIWQGKCGNFTRFMNHSCAPNCQFQTFSWMGTQRIVVVSKGITAGAELTVDYSAHYWENLDKICLCGEPCCRYKDRIRKPSSQEKSSDDHHVTQL